MPAGAIWLPAESPDALPDPGEVGGKAYNLARLVRAGAPVPPFFVVGARAFARVLGDVPVPEDDAAAEAAQARALAVEVPPGLRQALGAALAALGGGPVAVRSSAVGEDGGRSSFAGQFETVLGVPAHDEAAAWRAVRRVWASAFHPRALAYRRERGEGGGAMAVVVQRMVEPAAAGVAFSADPVTGDRATAVVSAVYGLGEGLVSGALDADTYRVRFGGGGPAVVEAALARKEQAYRTDPAGGVRVEPVPGWLAGAPALSDGEVRRIAEAARALAADFGAEQDVEWALAPGPGGRRVLYLLQARPVTTLQGRASGERRVWDNENLVESLPGVTLPLTYSIARHAFGHLLVQHCLALGASPAAVEADRDAFRGLVGLVRGRAYYDQARMQRIADLVPMIRLGVAEAVTAATPAPEGLSPELMPAARALSLPVQLLRDTARGEGALEAFYARAREVLDPLTGAAFTGMTLDELRGVYDRVDRGLLRHWGGPMLNDALMKNWMGVLQHLARSWVPRVNSLVLTNRLVAGGGGLVSTEPVRRLVELARGAGEDPRLRALLASDGASEEVWEAITSDPAYAGTAAGLRDYLARFGDRCADELKLEAPSFADDPAALVHALRAYALAPAPVSGDGGAGMRAEAEAVARERLAPEHEAPFFAVVELVRRLTRERENTRFERTLAFGVLRRVFQSIGRQLAEAGALEGPRDVFYLTAPEVFDWLTGHSASGDLRPLVAARRAEFEAYARMPDPPPRFATHGPPALSPLEPLEALEGPGAPPAPEGSLRGTGCCPGIVRAPVQIVRDPRRAGPLSGRILVAEHTDPGWTLLFPAAAGVLVERGSILSHAALVAREMGVPCVVGIPGLLDVLTDGEWVEMDGATGLVRRLATASPSVSAAK